MLRRSRRGFRGLQHAELVAAELERGVVETGAPVVPDEEQLDLPPATNRAGDNEKRIDERASAPAEAHIRYGFRMRSSRDLPIAWVRLTTFSLRRIFCTWFFTVSGLILRIAPISKLLLPR